MSRGCNATGCTADVEPGEDCPNYGTGEQHQPVDLLAALAASLKIAKADLPAPPPGPDRSLDVDPPDDDPYFYEGP